MSPLLRRSETVSVGVLNHFVGAYQERLRDLRLAPWRSSDRPRERTWRAALNASRKRPLLLSSFCQKMRTTVNLSPDGFDASRDRHHPIFGAKSYGKKAGGKTA